MNFKRIERENYIFFFAFGGIRGSVTESSGLGAAPDAAQVTKVKARSKGHHFTRTDRPGVH